MSHCLVSRRLQSSAAKLTTPFGVVDISCPILGPDGHALAVLTSPYIRCIDRHVGPSLDDARTLLVRAAQELSLNRQQRDDD